MENFEKQFNQPKTPEEVKNPELKQETPPVSESPQSPPENLNKSTESTTENQEKMEGQEKNLKLEEIRHEVENIGDRIGRPIDAGIKETVVMFKANELPTSDSCEGHIDRGLPVPYVEVSAPNEPEERFVGQNESFEKAAKKYNITTEEAKTSKIDEAYWEAMKECSQNEETEEYKKWNKENEKLLTNGHNLLEEFYKERQVEPDVKLQIEEGVGGFRIHNGGEDYQPIIENAREFSGEEKKVRAEKLEKYRPEMKEFTNFLKEKYFKGNLSERKSESKDLETMRKLQEHEDKQKLQELRKQLNITGGNPETPTEEKIRESPIRELLDNNPELAKIYNERSKTHEMVVNESGQILSDGQTYENNPKIRALVELADAIRKGLPDVQVGYVRLWRGNRPDEVGHNPSYTNSLEGIALPFLRGYNGVLSYIDVPQEEAKKYLTSGAKDSEFILPSEVVKNVKIVGFTSEETDDIKKKARSLSETEQGNGWTRVD